MLNQIIASVKDTAANAFLTPFFMANSAVAQRSFLDALKDPQTGFASHISDYILYELASFDSITGKITALDEPRLIIRAKDLLPPNVTDQNYDPTHTIPSGPLKISNKK